MKTKVFEEGSDVGAVSCGVRIVDDDVVKVGGDAFQAFEDLVDHFDEPAGGAALPPCGTTSHSNSVSSMQKAVGEVVSSSMVIWWK